MNMNLRNKILTAYGVLVVLLFLILFTGFSQFKKIASRLNTLQLAYLPVSNQLHSIPSFYHLNESFSVDQLIENQNNGLFLNAISTTQPKLLEQRLKSALQTTSAHLPQGSIQERLKKMVDLILQEHAQYIQTLQKTVGLISEKKIDLAKKLVPSLLQEKNKVLERVASLSNQISSLIRENIILTVREERKAVFSIATLSILTLIISLIIGFVAILSLKPLEELKQATQKIASGDLNERVSIQTNDEMGALAKEFNHMANSIQSRDKAIRMQQEQLNESQKLAVVGQMASKINHEIRNPLTSLSLNAELLKEEKLPSTALPLIENLAHQIERLKAISEQYLNLARKPKKQVGHVELKNILKELSLLFQAQCAQKHVTFETSISNDFPSLKLNQASLEQALINLCKNALEMLEPGQSFGVRAVAESDMLTLDIWDQGPGIPKEHAHKIFETFFTTKEKGTGLGLSITKDLIEEQGGTLSFQSIPNDTHMLIRFPKTIALS